MPEQFSVAALATHAAYLDRVLALTDDITPGTPIADLLCRTAPLTAPQAAFLVDRLAIPPLALLADADRRGWPLMIARVEFIAGRAPRFAFADEGGMTALVTVLRGRDGAGDDLIAMTVKDGLWGTLEGAAMAGEQDLASEAPRVHRDPLAWLRAGREGVVMLDRRRAVPALRECDELVVADVMWGEELERALRVRGPRIGVESGG